MGKGRHRRVSKKKRSGEAECYRALNLTLTFLTKVDVVPSGVKTYCVRQEH